MMYFAKFYEWLMHDYAFALAVPALIWQCLFLYLPLISIALTAWYTAYYQGSFFAGNFLTHLVTPEHVVVIGRSLGMSIIVAIACLIIAYPVAYYLALRVRRGRQLWLFLLMLPFWTNFLVQVYAWFFIVDRFGLINTVLKAVNCIAVPLHIIHTQYIVSIVMTYCYLPFMIIPHYMTFEKFDKRLLEAAADLGASPVRTFFSVTIPLTLGGMRNGICLVMVPAFGDYAICSLLSGGKYLYVGPLIAEYFLLVRDTATGAAFALLALIVLLMALGIIMLILRFIERKITC